ncbi:hypothetical protein HPB50_023494 [Hyalomma asiaticum]|uniref:Uncharacterized protein n=1 Tax=Hyalomma asiaticum TaxID=266040 RepID=A0ACB7S9S2_HYAAI|nr:hypothetical protein HPB50_023494 [Hyalomma asiaticum]
MLVGSDQLWTIVSGDIIRSTEVEGLVAVTTILGWMLQGHVKKTSFVNGTSVVMICVLRVQDEEAQEPEESMLVSFWTLYAM